MCLSSPPVTFFLSSTLFFRLAVVVFIVVNNKRQVSKKGEGLYLQLGDLLLDYKYVSVIKKHVAVNA